MGTLFTEIADPENAAHGSGTAESSPSLVSYSQDFGPKVIEKSFRIGISLRFIYVQPEMDQYQNVGRSRKLMSAALIE